LGECYSPLDSKDGTTEIMISPVVDDEMQDDYAFKSRGNVEIHNMGTMKTWYLTEKLDRDLV